MREFSQYFKHYLLRYVCLRLLQLLVLQNLLGRSLSHHNRDHQHKTSYHWFVVHRRPWFRNKNIEIVCVSRKDKSYCFVKKCVAKIHTLSSWHRFWLMIGTVASCSVLGEDKLLLFSPPTFKTFPHPVISIVLPGRYL